MKRDETKSGTARRVSTGPLRIYEEDGELFVTGFGLWFPVETRDEGTKLIEELENEGYRICY